MTKRLRGVMHGQNGDVRTFGRAGLEALPAEGVSTTEPPWRDIFDVGRRGHEAHRMIWASCRELGASGFSDHAMMDGLLRCPENALSACTEESRRYWFRQFETSGARGAAIAKAEIARAVAADSN